MNLTDFKIGDLVHHKTRLYLKMIVTDVSPENRVRCSWITKRGNRNTEIFHTFELEHEE